MTTLTAFIISLSICLPLTLFMPTIYSIIRIGWKEYKQRIYFFNQIIKSDNLSVYLCNDMYDYMRLSPIIINCNRILLVYYDIDYIEYFDMEEYFSQSGKLKRIKGYSYKACPCFLFNHLIKKVAKKFSKINTTKLDKISNIEKVVYGELEIMKRDRILNSILSF